MKQFVCFGEMLWDILPSGKIPGGAPMNVAIHLKHFGHQVSIISRIGSDDLGKELIDFVKSKELNCQLIQQGNTHLTGVVKVNMDDKSNVTYKIVKPVAWDYIQSEPLALDTVAQADCLVFGSLSARSPQSFETLKELLPIAKFKVLDVNLRPPYYDTTTLSYLMTQADVVKLNHHELAEICSWFFVENTLEEQISRLATHFQLKTICVTLGADGAVLYHQGLFYRSEGFPVEVCDTIGSGDSFLASFLSSFLQNDHYEYALQKACAVGALVATHHGATPFISEESIEKYLEEKAQTDKTNMTMS